MEKNSIRVHGSAQRLDKINISPNKFSSPNPQGWGYVEYCDDNEIMCKAWGYIQINCAIDEPVGSIYIKWPLMYLQLPKAARCINYINFGSCLGGSEIAGVSAITGGKRTDFFNPNATQFCVPFLPTSIFRQTKPDLWIIPVEVCFVEV